MIQILVTVVMGIIKIFLLYFCCCHERMFLLTKLLMLTSSRYPYCIFDCTVIAISLIIMVFSLFHLIMVSPFFLIVVLHSRSLHSIDQQNPLTLWPIYGTLECWWYLHLEWFELVIWMNDKNKGKEEWNMSSFNLCQHQMAPDHDCTSVGECHFCYSSEVNFYLELPQAHLWPSWSQLLDGWQETSHQCLPTCFTDLISDAVMNKTVAHHSNSWAISACWDRFAAVLLFITSLDHSSGQSFRAHLVLGATSFHCWSAMHQPPLYQGRSGM
jgi:hypothetical protein